MSDFSRLKAIALVTIASFILTACGGTGTGLQPGPAATPQPTPPPPAAQGINSINHIVFMFQENRSFDHYFGKLNDYRAKQGLPQDVDGIPAAGFTNPAYECTPDTLATCGVVASYHETDACRENTSPSWNESHVDYNRWQNKQAGHAAKMDGFVATAAGYSRAPQNFQTDIEGTRAMGYHTDEELNYYYFMASTFATSDRWFSPAPARSPTNRYYGFAATSEGIAYNVDANHTVSHKTIFQLLDEAGITWKVYHVPPPTQTGQPRPATYFMDYQWAQQHQAGHWVLLDEYFNDLKNGTLPQVALVESASGLDEHPGEGNILYGQRHVANIINSLMQSQSWKDSVFILTYDEMGGLFDHVPPPATMNPDGIKPFLNTGDIPGDFDRTGMRIPLIVVSPWVKKNYVSHTPADFTAILKFIETRYKLPNLTLRDAAQMDMTEFFDFSSATPPLLTPPTPPTPRDPGTIKCTFAKPKSNP